MVGPGLWEDWFGSLMQERMPLLLSLLAQLEQKTEGGFPALDPRVSDR